MRPRWGSDVGGVWYKFGLYNLNNVGGRLVMSNW